MDKLILFSVMLVAALLNSPARALEVQGFVTSNCQRYTGVIVSVEQGEVEFVDLDGHYQKLSQSSIDSVYVYNVIDNPIASFQIDPPLLQRLKAVYIEDSDQPRTLAFPVRFIEDLVIFYSIDGRTHVHTFADIYKLRPAPESALGVHRPHAVKRTSFEFSDQSGRCAGAQVITGGVKPTRVLSDKISVADFFRSFEQGYDSAESFEERTYLYARPLLFDQKTRLGLVLQGPREEPGLNLPVYFQWATGDPYRFQSWSAIGMKAHEFLPNAEPVFSLRSDVKSHIFHGMFIGNVAGVPAGQSIFLDNGGELFKLDQEITVQPSFNYLVMMGGDYGPYSLSVGFYYPDYGIKVHKEYREVRGSSPTYAVRAMYTTRDYRVRAITGFTRYDKGKSGKDDLLSRTGTNGEIQSVDSFEFNSTFIRGGIDYTFNPRLKASLDGIIVNGSYKERKGTINSDLRFNRLTIQGSVTQSFGNYVSLTGYANVLQNNFDTNFNNSPDKVEQRETRFFGTFEFIF